MAIGLNILQLRFREGLTQAQLASSLGVTKETVCRWERGKSSIREKHVRRLCELYGITSDDIMSDVAGLHAKESFKHDDMNTQAEADRDAVPIFEIGRSARGTSLVAKGFSRAPIDVIERHPNAAFVRMKDKDMTSSYPLSSLLLVDPSIKPFNGCTVVAIIDESNVLIRKYVQGNNLVMLSTHSHNSTAPDLTLDKRRVRSVGVVVWYQADHDLRA